MKSYIEAFEISVFKNNEERMIARWTNIYEFVSLNGYERLSEYFKIEKHIFEFLKSFYKIHHLDDYSDSGSSQLYFDINHIHDVDYDNYSRKQLGDILLKLRSLQKTAIRLIGEVDMDFLLICWIRGFCDLEFLTWGFQTLKSGPDRFSFYYEKLASIDPAEEFVLTDGMYFRRAKCRNLKVVADCGQTERIGELVNFNPK